MRMGRRPWFAVLLALAFSAAPAIHAQEQPTSPAPLEPGSAGPNPIEAIGNAVRGLFESIFGPGRARESEPQSAPPAAASSDAKPAPAPAQEPAGAQPPPPQAVAATPSAPATQSLQAAIAKGDYAAAVKMIDQGADVEAKDPNTGGSPLHYAVMKGEMPLVSLLLQHGADVNSRTKSNATPLHTAVLWRRTEIAEYLIEKGADVNAKTAGGTTPLGLALAANYHTIEQMLRRHGGH